MNENLPNNDFIEIDTTPETEATNEIPNKPEADTTTQVVGFWKFFGLIVLFAIPIVGFIAGIVFMFAPKNNNIKNYARAFITAAVANFVVTLIILSIILSAVGNMFLPAINDALGTEFESFSTILGTATAALSGDYAGVIEQLRPQLIEMLGEEYAGLIDELSDKKYNKLFKQLSNKEYREMLTDIKNNEYPNLKTVVGAEEFNGFVEELEKVADGHSSELFDELNKMLDPIFKRVEK